MTKYEKILSVLVALLTLIVAFNAISIWLLLDMITDISNLLFGSFV